MKFIDSKLIELVDRPFIKNLAEKSEQKILKLLNSACPTHKWCHFPKTYNNTGNDLASGEESRGGHGPGCAVLGLTDSQNVSEILKKISKIQWFFRLRRIYSM